jgi:hypothetical protein
VRKATFIDARALFERIAGVVYDLGLLARRSSIRPAAGSSWATSAGLHSSALIAAAVTVADASRHQVHLYQRHRPMATRRPACTLANRWSAKDIVVDQESTIGPGGCEMSDSVYRVTQVIGTSSESWAAAAKTAVETAAKTVRDLRVAEVEKMDVTIENGTIMTYRVRLNISFKYDTGD